MQKTKHPLALIILDGFGIRSEREGNAIALAKKPNFDFFCDYFPKTTLAHSGLSVGLPKDIVGNSEVGHKSIGSGRISQQTMYAIKKAIDYGQFFDNSALKKSIENAKSNNSAIHIIGLLSDGGGHSHIDHLFGIFKFLIFNNFKDHIYLHFFTDGRDVPPKSALKYIRLVQDTITNSGLKAKIATLGGRYWGMDRGGNWDRIEKHYNAMVGEAGTKIKEGTIEKYIHDSYESGITDEFLEPVSITDENGDALGNIKDGDSLIFFNFRPDRMREILRAFFDENFTFFERKKVNGFNSTFFKNLQATSLTEYEMGFEQKNISIAFPEPKLDGTLAQVLSENGLNQLHISESEKQAHITYFLNGGHEIRNKGEDWVAVPSLKVKTYDLQPQMSCEQIANVLIESLKEKKYDFYAVNFANPDMVGHTGNLDAGIKSIEFLDHQLGRIYKEIEKQDGFMVIVSDHGNAEEMINPLTKEIDTEHNFYPSPFLLISPKLKRSSPISTKIEDLARNPSGTLADVMPTILELYGIPMPEIKIYSENQGSSLIGRLK